MLKAVFLKEILDGIYGYKFLLASLLALVVIPFAVYSGAESYKRQLAAHLEAEQANLRDFLAQPAKPPHAAAHFGLTLNKPPTPLLALSTGVDPVLGVTARVDPHLTPELEGSQYGRTPILMLFGTLSYSFVIQVVFSLFALLLSADLISGEKEDGTLKLTLANAIPRSKVLLGKVAGGLLVLLAPVAIGTAAGLLFLTPLFGIDLGSDGWLRVVAIVAVSALYLTMTFLIGMVVSTFTRRRVTSLVTVVVIWVVLVFVIPRAVTSVAQQVYTIPSAQQVQQQVAAISDAAFGHFEERSAELRRERPEIAAQPLPRAFLIDNRRQMDEEVEREEAKVRHQVAVAQGRQVALATRLARFSPATSFVFAVTELSGTGVSRHQRFLSALNDYRWSFAGYFDRLERDGVELLEDYRAVPRFSFRAEGIAEVLPRLVLDVALMALTTVALFLVGHLRFLGYDAR